MQANKKSTNNHTNDRDNNRFVVCLKNITTRYGMAKNKTTKVTIISMAIITTVRLSSPIEPLQFSTTELCYVCPIIFEVMCTQLTDILQLKEKGKGMHQYLTDQLWIPVTMF